MSVKQSRNSLSPRGSKLLVEVIIGIIGILGIMLAQAGEPGVSKTLQKLHNKGEMISVEVQQAAPKVDWIEILF